MAKTILYIIGSLDLAGTERHLVQLVQQLDRDRFRPVICTLGLRGPLAPDLLAQDIAVLQPPFADFCHRWKWSRAILHSLSWLWLTWVMLVLRPAIVHCFLPEAYVVGGIAAKLSWRPNLVMSRRSMNDYQQSRDWLRRLEHWLFPMTVAGLGNSRKVVTQLAEEGFTPERLLLIYNGVDLARFASHPDGRAGARQSLGLPAEGLVMVLVANLIPYKGHDNLLRALSDMMDELPCDWRVVFVGRDDGIGQKLRSLAQELDLSEHLIWAGPQNDVVPYLTAADMGLLVSQQEGFSNAILEAMAASLPMVVTDVGGNGEAVVDEETGFVVPPNETAALGQAILKLATDPNRRRQMGAAGRDRAEALFPMPVCISRYEQLYELLLSGTMVKDLQSFVDRSAGSTQIDSG